MALLGDLCLRWFGISICILQFLKNQEGNLSVNRTKLSVGEMHDNQMQMNAAAQFSECSHCLSCFPHLGASGEDRSGSSGKLGGSIEPNHLFAIPAHQLHPDSRQSTNNLLKIQYLTGRILDGERVRGQRMAGKKPFPSPVPL